MRDPDFLAALRLSIEKGLPPVGPIQKKLTRLRLPNYFQGALKKAVLMHLMLILLSLSYAFMDSLFLDRPTSTLSLSEQRSAIRVEVLDLPTQKLSDLKQVDLSEKAVEKVKEVAVPKDAMVLQEKKRKDKMDNVRKELRTEKSRKRLIEDLLSEEDGAEPQEGRAQLAGNILSEGYSITGDVATDRDVHAGKVKDHVMKFWKVPAWMAASKQYRAEIVVKLDPKGKVISKNLVTRSGNDDFDRYAIQSIEAADPFPAPPDSLKMIYLEEGVLCAFPE